MRKQKGCVRIATFNVHFFRTAKGRYNIDRIAQLIADHDIDVIGIQEATCKGSNPLFGPLQKDAGLEHAHYAEATHSFGNAVLSRFPIVRKSTATSHYLPEPRSCALADLDTPYGTLSFGTLHLDYLEEPNRQVQFDELSKHVAANMSAEGAFVVGDFNALCREDYTDAGWDHVRQVRESGGWEPPQSSLVEHIRDKLGWEDAAASTSEHRPFRSDMVRAGTCRFDTRIDFLWRIAPEAPSSAQWQFVTNTYQVVQTDTSDHCLVYVDIKRT